MMKRRLVLVWGPVICASALALLLFHQWHRSSQVAELNACVGNLCLYYAAKEQYALEHGLPNGAEIDPAVLEPGLKKHWADEMCPSAMHNTYALGKIGERPKCSIHGAYLDTHLPDGTRLTRESMTAK